MLLKINGSTFGAMKRGSAFFWLLLALLPLTTLAQKDIIQFSGIVRDARTATPLPFCGVYIQNSFRGTTTNMNGFFSMPAALGDTIIIQTLGYRNQKIVIPKDAKGSYSSEILMVMDTVRLQEIVIFPLPSPNQLRQAIITLEVPTELSDLAAIAIAQANLDKNTLTTPYDGSENYNFYLQQYVARQYYTGQSAPIQLMNPLAWAQFMQALKRGDFKRK
jgi:hypothetical protein